MPSSAVIMIQQQVCEWCTAIKQYERVHCYANAGQQQLRMRSGGGGGAADSFFLLQHIRQIVLAFSAQWRVELTLG